MNNRIIFHIDVNSAFLSWEAVYRLKNGEKQDIRTIPSAIGGSEKERHGIILAKSIPAKAFGIKTAETIFSAVKKCPNLLVISPTFKIYSKYSKCMMNILKRYTSVIEKFSIDECFLEFSNVHDPVKLAHEIKDTIKNELGFTVNIGISSNKLLSKMASDFEKPDKVHTLFKDEIQKKMWHLPVKDLFMVGKVTASKLNNLGIFTIGDLAKYDRDILKSKFKSYGIMLVNYANGIDDSKICTKQESDVKGIGNSTTISYDITDKEKAYKILLSLAENVSQRLRNCEKYCRVVCVTIKTSQFIVYSRQRKLSFDTDCTDQIIKVVKELFDEAWKGEPIRLLGVRVSQLTTNEIHQISMFEDKNIQKNKKIDKVVDELRNKYGSEIIKRSIFLKK
ncbi:Y-family DNA polymerase [Haloimpatiens sp. FM7330]|uniref:Y-family DNA polymerase n=1 Tax=Haloimpatiens sp. FM7330 TaxID=3298610 RepID=UPI0036427C4C